jgi:predicted anti-sigma-YlaC factor YlaD
MTDKLDKRCSTCTHWYTRMGGDYRGECMRSTPKVVTTTVDLRAERYPLTYPSDRCRSWAE